MSIQIPENMEEVAMKIAAAKVHGEDLAVDDVIKDAVRDTMQVISLGKRILRTDTAGICTMSMLMMQLECEQG